LKISALFCTLTVLLPQWEFLSVVGLSLYRSLDDASPLLLFLLIDLFEEASERAAV
jgi:hypothetical protein